MEAWRKVWREGLAPTLSLAATQALYAALWDDDPRLTQGSTTTPPPLQCVLNWPCEGACLIGFAGWQGEGLATVGEVEAYFAARCFESDQRMGEPAAIRFLLHCFDDWDRETMRWNMIPEVALSLESRKCDAMEAGFRKAMIASGNPVLAAMAKAVTP